MEVREGLFFFFFNSLRISASSSLFDRSRAITYLVVVPY